MHKLMIMYLGAATDKCFQIVKQLQIYVCSYVRTHTHTHAQAYLEMS